MVAKKKCNPQKDALEKKELPKVSEVYRLKGVLQSDDGGKTWWVYRIDYVSQSESGTGDPNKFSFVADYEKKAFETMILERVVEES